MPYPHDRCTSKWQKTKVLAQLALGHGGWVSKLLVKWKDGEQYAYSQILRISSCYQGDSWITLAPVINQNISL